MKMRRECQPDKLPLDEGVVEGVDVGGDEGSSPIDVKSHRLKVRLGVRREVVEPVLAWSELGDLEQIKVKIKIVGK